jgi:hypothetical protein
MELAFSGHKYSSRMINVLRHNTQRVAVSGKPAPGGLIGYAKVSTQG